MNLTELLKKVAKGETLTDEEKAYLAAYKEDDSRIPKSRLDEELAKKKDLQKQLDATTAKQSELEAQLEELKTSGLSAEEKVKKEVEKEINKLKAENAALLKERDEKAAKIAEIEFNDSVSKVAAKHNFADPEYLGYLVKSGNVDLADEKKVTEFVKGLETSKPNLFKSNAKPGGGTKQTEGQQGSTGEARMKELLAKPTLTMAEAAEVNKLDTEQKTAAAAAATGAK
ncbi:MAG: hypothetical protein WCI51_08235 [Lentisphaerota bacterium]